MNSYRIGWIARLAIRVLPIVLLVALAGAVPAGACCCTCEDSKECFPVCVGELHDAASCNAACEEAKCGSIAPCPDPTDGKGCDPGEISCFDMGNSAAVPAPAVSTSGMLITVLLLAGIGVVGLAQRRRRTLSR